MKVRYGRFSKKHANQAATGILIVKFITFYPAMPTITVLFLVKPPVWEYFLTSL
jgi:hypothetical protein